MCNKNKLYLYKTAAVLFTTAFKAIIYLEHNLKAKSKTSVSED